VDHKPLELILDEGDEACNADAPCPRHAWVSCKAGVLGSLQKAAQGHPPYFMGEMYESQLNHQPRLALCMGKPNRGKC
jgi:hypothetical protein